MSRCKEMRLKNRLPAFNLEMVRQHSEVLLSNNVEEICNAARCDPISDINEYVAIGSWRDAADASLLRTHGITHVLNVARELTSGSVRSRAQSVDFVTSKSIPIDDSLDEVLERHFDEAFEFIRDATHSGRVLVHCRRGISRSAAIVIAYLMATEGETFHAALSRVREQRPCVSLNLSFMQRLEEYEAHLHAMPRQGPPPTAPAPATDMGAKGPVGAGAGGAGGARRERLCAMEFCRPEPQGAQTGAPRGTEERGA